MRFEIEKYRKEIGMSQKELAQKAGISRTTLSGLESGRVKTSTAGTIAKIAKALKKDIAEIFLT